ncbi:MAG: helix-turn-helix transcriptional regulator [Clostridia bacterium]|nr:helix-turn-helix transcriptional regulator [Clostridia bacterium]
MKTCTLQLQYYRELNRLSIRELAFLLQVSPATVINYEKGNTFPTMDMVIRLAHILNTSTDQLLGI